MNILTFLRATDLSALQRTCSCFNQRDLVNAVVEYAADEVVSVHLKLCRISHCFILTLHMLANP